MKHQFSISPYNNTVLIDLVGVGGTGSHMFSSICDVAQVLPNISDIKLKVRVWDGDEVSQSNIGRQRFYQSDIGRNKAEVLVQRANMFLGLDFEARAEPLTAKYSYVTNTEACGARIIVGCVDTAAARRVIDQVVCYGNENKTYWLDCGNQQTTGQVILGQPISNKAYRDFYARLPTVLELFPQLADATIKEDNQPSCSVAEAIARQDLTVNRAIANAAAEMLWCLLRHGEISYCGRFINTRTGTSTKLEIDPEAWKRFGHKGKRKPAPPRLKLVKPAVRDDRKLAARRAAERLEQRQDRQPF